MCGLVGVLSNTWLSAPQLEVFRWLLHLDTLRGEDSTGVAFNRTKVGTAANASTLVKAEGQPAALFRKFPEIFNRDGSFVKENHFNFKWVMGHNRAMTIGAINAKNAHPFHHGKIIGAHNGTIRTGLHTLPKGEGELKGQTDSEQVIYALSKGTSLKTIHENLKGAMALSWANTEDNTYHLFRNIERPLHYYISTTGGFVIYASEAWMIKIAAARAKLALPTEPIALLENEHITFDLSQAKEIVVTKEKLALPLAPVHHQTHCTADYYVTGGNGRWANGQYGFPKKQEPKTPKWFKTDDKGNNNVIDFQSIKPATGWLKTDLSKYEFERVSRYGCVACGVDLDYNDYILGSVFFMEKDSPFCEHCAKVFKEPEKQVG